MTDELPTTFPPDGESVKRERDSVLRELEKLEPPKPFTPERTS